MRQEGQGDARSAGAHTRQIHSPLRGAVPRRRRRPRCRPARAPRRTRRSGLQSRPGAPRTCGRCGQSTRARLYRPPPPKMSLRWAQRARHARSAAHAREALQGAQHERAGGRVRVDAVEHRRHLVDEPRRVQHDVLEAPLHAAVQRRERLQVRGQRVKVHGGRGVVDAVGGEAAQALEHIQHVPRFRMGDQVPRGCPCQHCRLACGRRLRGGPHRGGSSAGFSAENACRRSRVLPATAPRAGCEPVR